MQESTHLIHQYLRHDKKFPHLWCPGCGNGIVLGALIRAIHHLGCSKNEIALVSGIGCSSRMPTYVDFNTLHTVHGRALTFATGIKLANPALKVIAIMGDGDAMAIGGNHFIHAARRNIDITALIMNNSIYGMTGGQSSPTTPFGSVSATAPYTQIERPFQIAEMAIASGASYVARGTVYHARKLIGLIEQAIRKPGFSVVEIITHCHVQFGKYNQMGSHIDMLKWQKSHAVPAEKAGSLSDEALKDKFTIGVLANRDFPIFDQEYEKIRQAAMQAQP